MDSEKMAWEMIQMLSAPPAALRPVGIEKAETRQY
jgi:hypothetical protein